MARQVIVTTVFGQGAEHLDRTFRTFAMNSGTELHVFVYGSSLPRKQLPEIKYHLVEPDPRFVSVRRDALFRRWIFPDSLEAEFALVVDGTDVLCLRPLPPFDSLLRGAALAAVPEWGGPVPLQGQGYTSAFLNAGITFWNLPRSRAMRTEIINRGRSFYRGPFDDQSVLNEVAHTSAFEDLVILPSQFNWRAFYKKSGRGRHNWWQGWPRVDSLDGVYLYHNAHCLDLVQEALSKQAPAAHAALPPLPQDAHPLSRKTLFWRRIAHKWGLC